MNINRDINNIPPDSPHTHKKCICWSAIILAAIVGIGISFLLNLFAIGVGLSAFISSDSTMPTFALGGFIGLVIIAIISMSSLGWVAGFLGGKSTLSHCPNTHCNMGCLYGFGAWCLALILTICLSANMGKFISYSMVSLTSPTTVADHIYHKKNFRMANETVTRNATGTAPTSNVATVNDQTSPPVVTKEDIARTIAATSFISFLLFLIGALSASIAGHCAFKRVITRR